MPGLTFVGTGSPAELRDQIAEQQRKRIEEVRRHKNEKARRAGQRAAAVLSDLGISRKEIGRRPKQQKVKKPQNYRWNPNG